MKYGEVVYPRGGVEGSRPQVTYQLLPVHEGAAVIVVDGVPIEAGAGTVTLLVPGSTVRQEFRRGIRTHHAWVHVLPYDLPEELIPRLEAAPRQIPLSPQMTSVLGNLLASEISELPTAEGIATSIAVQMLWIYAGEAELLGAGADVRDPRRLAVSQARRYVVANVREPFDLEALAHEATVSPTQLIRAFRAQLGTTPMAWAWAYRTARGIDLLAQTGLSVAEIAERMGFRTSFHFSRRVRDASGLTPTQIRRRAWTVDS